MTGITAKMHEGWALGDVPIVAKEYKTEAGALKCTLFKGRGGYYLFPENGKVNRFPNIAKADVFILFNKKKFWEQK